MRGWLSYIAKARSIEQQVDIYRQLKQQLLNYCTIPVLDFDRAASQEFQRLKKIYPRLGTMDLKIAAIALANKAIVLTRNKRDFGQIEDLSIEDWTQ
jgi:tRNA(fMet)-specific endonuclease VapC